MAEWNARPRAECLARDHNSEFRTGTVTENHGSHGWVRQDGGSTFFMIPSECEFKVLPQTSTRVRFCLAVDKKTKRIRADSVSTIQDKRDPSYVIQTFVASHGLPSQATQRPSAGSTVPESVGPPAATHDTLEEILVGKAKLLAGLSVASSTFERHTSSFTRDPSVIQATAADTVLENYAPSVPVNYWYAPAGSPESSSLPSALQRTIDVDGLQHLSRGNGGSSSSAAAFQTAQPVVPGQVPLIQRADPHIAELQAELQALASTSTRCARPNLMYVEAKLLESQRLAEEAAAVAVECLETFGWATVEVRKQNEELKEKVKSISLRLRDLASFRAVGMKRTLLPAELVGGLCSFLRQPTEDGTAQFTNCAKFMHRKFLLEALQGKALQALQLSLTKRLLSGCQEGQLLAVRLIDLMENFVTQLKDVMPEFQVEPELPSASYRKELAIKIAEHRLANAIDVEQQQDRSNQPSLSSSLTSREGAPVDFTTIDIQPSLADRLADSRGFF
jgi:hypothetical protein